MKTFAVFSQLLLLFLGVFLMIVVLLQRGRGGGLAGAFGGLGGQSAFGTKAGDMFTKITIVIAICWVLVSGGSGYILRDASTSRARGGLPQKAPLTTGAEADNTPPPVEKSDAGNADGKSGTAAETDQKTGTTPSSPPAAPTGPLPAPGESN